MLVCMSTGLCRQTADAAIVCFAPGTHAGTNSSSLDVQSSGCWHSNTHAKCSCVHLAPPSACDMHLASCSNAVTETMQPKWNWKKDWFADSCVMAGCNSVLRR
ncbi:unnamed protein product [Ostreobium quekettii]|uniref:Uncharacterized protein n=1 Tax=Ostreobium quekettii TaxID=121088 RepID=A0A8S1ISD3_9CHLO|nr:unnamed protein product [Ostreobium quekettii]